MKQGCKTRFRWTRRSNSQPPNPATAGALSVRDAFCLRLRACMPDFGTQQRPEADQAQKIPAGGRAIKPPVEPSTLQKRLLPKEAAFECWLLWEPISVGWLLQHQMPGNVDGLNSAWLLLSPQPFRLYIL